MARGLPPLNALAVFEAAARHMSFTCAAEELCVTQAAVSHQIKTLEDRLGITLFHRLGRGQGLVLTEAGRAYLPLVSAALDTIRAATRAVVESRRTRALNIATLDSFGEMWLLPRLGRFMRAHPDIEVRITSSGLNDDSIASGEVDLEIRYGDGAWPDMEVTRLLTEPLFPVCAPALITGEHPLAAPEDLRHHTLLHETMAVGWADWLRSAGAQHVGAGRGPRFNHANLATQAAINGDGVALGRGALVLDALRHGTLVRPFEHLLPSPFAYYFLTSRARAADRTIAEFRSWLIEQTAASQRELDALVAPALPGDAGRVASQG